MDKSQFKYLDKKEMELLDKITKEYEEFVEPKSYQKHVRNFKGKVSDSTPVKVKDVLNKPLREASEWGTVIKVMEKSGEGIGKAQEFFTKYTLSKNQIINSLNKKSNISLNNYEEICMLRSYDIQNAFLNRRKLVDLPAAFFGGGVPGFFGFKGIPFNLAFTFFMYFRTVQSIGLSYGYDVQDDPRELEFASSVVISCIQPNLEEDENLSSIIGKMMIASNLSALQESLSKYSYLQMAERGGVELL